MDAAGAGLRRVTDVQRTDPAPAPPAGDSTSALQAQAAARARAGASEVLWAPDGTLLAVHRGHLCRVPLTAGAPERLPVGDDVSDVSLSPDGTRVTFLRDGDLWWWTRGAAAAERLTSIGVPGIAKVPLGSYNTLDREVGTGVWGADWLPYAWAPDGQSIVFHASDRRHLRAVPFPSYLGAETIGSQVRRGYPGDENERRTLSLLRVGTRAIEPIALEAPGRRGISDVQWSPSGRLLIDQVFVRSRCPGARADGTHPRHLGRGGGTRRRHAHRAPGHAGALLHGHGRRSLRAARLPAGRGRPNAGGPDVVAGRACAGALAQRTSSRLALVRRRHPAGTARGRGAAGCHAHARDDLAVAGVRGPALGACALPDVHEPRRRLRGACAHPRARESRSHDAASRESSVRSLRTPCATAGAD